MTHEEALLIDIKFQLDMYGSGQGSAEDTLARVREIVSSPSLTDDQQIVLEWLKEEYKRTKWSSPFGTVYSTINIHEMFVRMRLTKAQQFQVLAAFAEWGMKREDNE